MKKSTKIMAMVLALALTAAMSVGLTMAYLTDTDEDVNVMTLGNVKIDQLEYERINDETKDEDATVQEFHDNKPLYPAVTDDDFQWTTGDSYVDWEQIGKEDYTSGIWNPDEINNEVDKMVFVKNKGDYDAYVRSVFAFEAGNYETLDEYLSMVHLNINTEDWTWEWVETPVDIGEGTYFVATATYNKVLKPGALTEISLAQIALDPSATNEDVEAFGDTFQVLVKSQAIQADGFADPDTALNEGFGEITETENIPWESDSPTKGIDLRTALHNLNGDTTQVITSKVSNVIYALNEEYPEIVDGYEGTLVDVEQDVPVYAYYVPNGDNYDVYFLADDTIYSPKNSGSLYMYMTALETVDTHNYDVSRVETMYAMFAYCGKLNNMDLSEWDTSNVTNMRNTFFGCDTMTELDVAGWNVKKVETIRCFAYSCDNLKTLNVSGWNIASACEANWAFASCPALVEVDATGSATTGITNSYAMFQQDYALTEIKGHENWTFPNLVDAGWMFENCQSLPEATVSNWGLSSLEQATGMFSGCRALTKLTGSGNWDLGNVVNASYMFQNCEVLTYIDATNWGLKSCLNTSYQFAWCKKLEAVEGSENWDVSNVQDMTAMFYYNHKLKDLDVSTWDPGEVTSMYVMFMMCYDLEELDVSNWDVSKVTTFGFMFKGTGSLGDMKIKELDVSDWDTGSATDMECMFYGCGQLTELDLSGWNVEKLQNVGHMFADCFKLEKINFSGWNTKSLSSMDAMFNDCRALKTIDVSDFDTATVTVMSQVFENCDNLTEIIGLDQWDTSNVTTMQEMFSNSNGGSALEVVDLSGFDTSKVTNTQYMFKDCINLQTVYVSEKWDMSNVTNSYAMFTNCPKLVGGNGTTYQSTTIDGTYACVDTAENPGYLTYKAAE